MKPIHLLALSLILGAAGCGGHGGVGSALPSDVSVMGTLSALPAPKLTVHTSSSRLHKMDGLGGIPTANTLATATMMDAPPVFGGLEASEVDLAIVRIDAIGDAGTGTLAQFDTPYVANVLDFQTEPLAFDAVPMAAGHYSRVEVVIDPAASHVVVNGRMLPIHFSNNLFGGADAGTAAGDVVMDVTASIDLIAGNPGSFNIDFNAAESLALAADGNSVNASPVLAAASGAQGAIAGRVVNAYGGPVSHAIVVAANHTGTSVNSTLTDASGNFYLHTIEPGSMRLTIYNEYRNGAGNRIKATGQTSGRKDVRGPKVTVVPQTVLNVGSLAD